MNEQQRALLERERLIEKMQRAWLNNLPDIANPVISHRAMSAALDTVLATLSRHWQPIETAPRDGTPIIGGWYESGEWLTKENLFWGILDGTEYGWTDNPRHSHPGKLGYHPTHWMLETPPPPFVPATDAQVEAEARQIHDYEMSLEYDEGQRPAWGQANDQHKQALLRLARQRLDGNRNEAMKETAND